MCAWKASAKAQVGSQATAGNQARYAGRMHHALGRTARLSGAIRYTLSVANSKNLNAIAMPAPRFRLRKAINELDALSS